MAKQPYRDVTDKCKAMRKSKLIRLCEEELTEEELNIFLMRVYNNYNRDRVADEAARCKECVSRIFMRAVHKLRNLFDENEENLNDQK